MRAPRQLLASTRADQPALGFDPLVSTFLTIVDRLEATVVEETDALRRNQPARIGESGQLKRQGMLELGRIMQRLTPEKRTTQVRERLDQLHARLEDNHRMLDVHLRAVRGIAETIASTMREVESDGTYSKAAGR